MNEHTTAPVTATYEDRLGSNGEWALDEGSRHFEERSAVHEALRRIVKRLEELGIPHAIAGGMALFRHGYRRFTEDVDILVTKQGLNKIHDRLEGRGYLPPFSGSKNLRDTQLGVRIEFLVAGQYPGDGQPKPVAFPDPSEAAVDIDGMPCVGLHRLIEMKLASGMTSAGRARDLADVQALIETLSLKREVADSLHDYVRSTYEQLWDGLHETEQRFMKLWGRQAADQIQSMDDMVRTFPADADQLRTMRADGVQVEQSKSGELYLVTTDPEVAARHGMHAESEFLDVDE